MPRGAVPGPLAVAIGALFAIVAVAPAGAAERYALLVGVNEYQHAKLAPLKYAVDDVTELADVLKAAGYQVTLLTDATSKRDPKLAPTKAIIEKHLHDVVRRCQKGDTLILALTGHGLQFGAQRDAYYCPVDARPLETETDTLVSVTKIYAELEASFAGVKIVLVDACRNDPTPGRGRGLDADTGPAPPKGVGVLFSCSAGQRAFEHDSLKHGVFFHYVLQGLKKEAADRKGNVTFESLSTFVREEVSDKVHELFPEQKPDQTPNVKADLAGRPPVLLTLASSSSPPEPKDALVGSKAGEEKSFTSLGMKFCWCPPGKFTMGPDFPTKEVTVTLSRGFWLGKFEVTQTAYERLVGENPSYYSTEKGGKDRVRGLDTSNLPVDLVNWKDAMDFCRKLTEAERKAGRLGEGWEFTLPTEAQWEYACRAGTTTATPFGDKLSSKQANFNGASPSDGSEPGPNLDRNTNVGTFKANPWGFHDMHGNVMEWCRDYHTEQLPGGTDPEVAESRENERVLRGGSYASYNWGCRSTSRYKNSAGNTDTRIGFRVALVAK